MARAGAAGIDRNEAEALLACEGADFEDLLARAGAAREAARGRGVSLCAIMNARSGRCGEDCAFCAQSAHHRTAAPVYPLALPAKMVKCAARAAVMGAREFSIVTSGTAIRAEEEVSAICEAVACIAAAGAAWPCASLGSISGETMARLRRAGLANYHHNLETARSFFPSICTTRSFDEGVATVRRAQRQGLQVCSGGIFGMGESNAQRVELAETLRELDVDSVPINFLTPIPGTPLADKRDLTPRDCLKIVAVFRLMLPDKDIRVCGGRELNLGALQSRIFTAGANGVMIGNYLTTAGRDAALDREMIAGEGLEVRPRGVRP